ncbi:enoyl-CoA hydratase-related protein [Yunchengibacter salinarum]|uniref:enoyl-CoA hydratase-related protein n=1 Tax=Yunchengibacter salinarum TaxID=3133399 RepID=UPI0035B69824
MSHETLLVDEADGVVTVTLNRPDKLNAVTSRMLEDLAAVLDRVEREDSLRCLVITGAGKGFCAGQDLNDRMSGEGDSRPDLGKTVGEGYNPVLTRLYHLPVPTIAAVNGTAAGAGANMALACDLVYAAESAKFVQVYANLGLVPDAGGTFILPRLVGMARAKEMAFTARPVRADEALSIGMIAGVEPDGALMQEVSALARKMAKSPTMGFALTKDAFHKSFSNSLEDQLALERDYMQKAGFSDDYAEGVKAFLEKRKPVFKGH